MADNTLTANETLGLGIALPSCDGRWVVRAILRLFPTCRPTAILRRVVTVVVDPLKRVFDGRSWTHVRPKICERVAPTRTHGDSPAAVAVVVGRSWIEASVFHRLPRSVGGFTNAIVGGCAVLCDAFAMKAPAALVSTTPQIASACIAPRTALAATVPHRATISVRDPVKDGESSKAPSGQILGGSRHATI